MYVKFEITTPTGKKTIIKHFSNLSDAIEKKNALNRMYGRKNVISTVIKKY